LAPDDYLKIKSTAMKKPYIIDRPLADMHGDGVRFNEQLKKRAAKHVQSKLKAKSQKTK
jgi:hypothetical protein